jgi:hypothetical protein
VKEMKKNLAAGLVAVGLIAAGGTGFMMGHAKENTQNPVYYMQQQGVAKGQMTQMMNTTNTNTSGAQLLKQNPSISFEEMLPYMKKMHPDLSDAQLKALFEQMHGPNGACSNGQGMMGSTSGNLQ